MKLVTSKQMQAVDRAAIDGRGIPGPELMENAGRGIAERLLELVIDAGDSPRVAIFCGKGNNGGDGFVIGRYLAEAGAQVVFYFVGPVDKMSTDARLNFDRAAQMDLGLNELSTVSDLPDPLEADFIIDAVFGTGFEGAPRGLAGDIIKYINGQQQPIIAIDMPSGLNADNGRAEGAVVIADYTFTLALPKFGLFVSPGRELAGMVQVVPIGIPDDVIAEFDSSTYLITSEEVAALLPVRPADGHKGTFGKLLLVAGSSGLTGAASLAAKSALRCGCGLAKVAAPQTVLPTIASSVIEATGHALPDVAKKGALALRSLGEVRKLAKDHDALAIGPGLGQHHETQELVRRLVSKLDRPAVIDADGLNALVGHLDTLTSKDVSEAPALVLTPHPGEFKRLSGTEVPTDIHQRIEAARAFAREHHVVLVLKGSPSLVASPDGQIWLNPTGNNGMATGGSGDVLTGAIGSFMVQGMSPIDAAIAATYLHGLAGDMAAAELGERSVIAGDLIDFLPEALLSVER
ncbi:MAG: NAD(P)H-hydrate dehydratase [bacterium]